MHRHHGSQHQEAITIANHRGYTIRILERLGLFRTSQLEIFRTVYISADRTCIIRSISMNLHWMLFDVILNELSCQV
jgi:hypothetical protein